MATATPVKVGPIGGGRGSPKDILPSQLPRTLESIEIWSSADGRDSHGVINGIRFTYVDDQGMRHNVPSDAQAWGTTTGNLHELKIATGSNEYVKQVDGSIGPAPDGDTCITSLKFITTSTGKYMEGGDPINGTAFTVPLDNAGIFAFFGRANTYLNAVGFYVKPRP